MMSYIKTSAESKKTESGLGSRGTRKVRPQSGIPFTATFWRTLSEEELKINNDHKSAHWCWMMDEHGENLHKEAENTHQPPIKVRDGAPACSAGSGSSMRGVPQKTEWNPRGGGHEKYNGNPLRVAAKFSADFLPQKGVADTCKGLKGEKRKKRANQEHWAWRVYYWELERENCFPDKHQVKLIDTKQAFLRSVTGTFWAMKTEGANNKSHW